MHIWVSDVEQLRGAIITINEFDKIIFLSNSQPVGGVLHSVCNSRSPVVPNRPTPLVSPVYRMLYHQAMS